MYMGEDLTILPHADMHRIELYGIGRKSGKDIEAIIGFCYITRLKTDVATGKAISPYQAFSQRGNIMNLATLINSNVSVKGNSLILSTIKNVSSKTTVFGIKLNEIVSDEGKDEFITVLKKYPTVAVFTIK